VGHAQSAPTRSRRSLYRLVLGTSILLLLATSFR
jgi:hypothetical protein